MPTRLLRESILDSERVCSLSFPAEVFYRRLMSVVDDFGRFDGRLSVLRSRLYPLQIEKVREADIERWIAECVKAGLIVLYSVSAKPYILFRNLGEPRAKESKYPAPPFESERTQPHASANICAQTQTDVNGCAQTLADVPYSDSDSDSDSTALDGSGRSLPKSRESPMFVRFWEAYPKKVAKVKAAESFERHRPDEALLERMLAALGWQRQSPDWVKENGRFIPHATTWLNQRRWEDAPPGPLVPSIATKPPINHMADLARTGAMSPPMALPTIPAAGKGGGT